MWGIDQALAPTEKGKSFIARPGLLVGFSLSVPGSTAVVLRTGPLQFPRLGHSRRNIRPTRRTTDINVGRITSHNKQSLGLSRPAGTLFNIQLNNNKSKLPLAGHRFRYFKGSTALVDEKKKNTLEEHEKKPSTCSIFSRTKRLVARRASCDGRPI